MGVRNPAVFLDGGAKIAFFTSMNESLSHGFIGNVLQQNHVYKIEIHQRYISNGNYQFFIKIDGEEYSAINSKAKQFYNVKVYAANPWYNASKGFISNFNFTNFF